MSDEPKCPFDHAAALPVVLPDRIRKLPVHRGFPVPWFVMIVDGEFDFRVMDHQKLIDAHRCKLCWVCGEPLGAFKSFVIGPMCGINHTSAEPPSHRECAIFSATHCPFLTIPHMKRREKGLPEDMSTSGGFAIKRNPKACGVWTVKHYKVFSDRRGGFLFDIGEPVNVEWFAEGRKATRAEVEESINSGIHLLEEMCDTEDTPARRESSHRQLVKQREALNAHLPP